MPVALRIVVIAAAVVAFLVISFFVARWLTADNRERSYVTELLTYQSKGDSGSMLDLMPACAASAACRARTRALARRFAGGGDVKIVRYDSATTQALNSESGPTRVAWLDGGPDSPIWVQCIEVTRSGLAFLGGKVTLDSISKPIGGEGTCPA